MIGVASVLVVANGDSRAGWWHIDMAFADEKCFLMEFACLPVVRARVLRG